ncbi:MAG: hypothetical protein H7Y38_05335, partial [Armatimonadetes bacterium]|nr:hypothetical protein [Armatimonadota bacterium]
GESAGGEVPVAPPVLTPMRPRPRPARVAQAKPALSATDAAKKQAAQALGSLGDSRIRLETSFDGVPKTLGGTGERIYPATPKPAADNGGKVKPIVQGRVPFGLRPDPFLSRLTVPISREFAYSLAVPYRLASPAKPPALPRQVELPPEIALGPLPYVPRRVAGFLEFGGVSAILETGGLGTGEINIVQPGSSVASGVANIPNLTVESISSTELVLRAEDGRSTKVALSGVPGGVANPVVPGRPGGPPPGIPGAPGRSTPQLGVD